MVRASKPGTESPSDKVTLREVYDLLKEERVRNDTRFGDLDKKIDRNHQEVTEKVDRLQRDVSDVRTALAVLPCKERGEALKILQADFKTFGGKVDFARFAMLILTGALALVGSTAASAGDWLGKLGPAFLSAIKGS